MMRRKGGGGRGEERWRKEPRGGRREGEMEGEVHGGWN